ncbi:bacterio-opsin activator domain-containing protein [Natronococcus jeotgali]|uniref:PAS/PAC sensor protein n=1 Tax=Natronococcus jeotgali DSM 18795 TaxID=1227498 RepID=L9XUJ7_9EURY|nr:PAS/PAC sensor protein [Natronococcus jeotgali DSM 18795]
MIDRPEADRSDGEAGDSEANERATIPGNLARQVFEASPVGTIVLDAAGEMVFANERAAETLDLSRAEIAARTYDSPDWNIYYDDGRPVPADENPVARVLESGDPVFGFEHWIELPDGSERWLSSNTTPVPDESGATEYVIVAFEDVTALKRREKQLTSDHVRRLEFWADESAVPPSLRVEGGDTRIDVDSIVPLPDGTTVQYMGTSDLTASEFVTAVEEVPHYLDVRLLSSIDGRSRVEAHAEPTTVSHVFPSLGGRACAIVVTPDEVRFLGELPGDVDPRLAADGIREFHSEAELVSEELVYSPHLLYDVVADALTDRQLAALDAAYFGGYFETPRTSTGEELADRFDVTRQTFNQHLRKAQRTVFRHLFEESGADAR